MTNYIQVKVSFKKADEEGNEKKVSQNILVDAMSFTEAETRAVECMTPYITVSDSLKLSSMKKSPYSEVFLNFEGGYWYEGLVKFVHEQDNGKLRVEKLRMLIQGDSVQDATSNLEQAMKGTLADYVIDGIKVTNIGEVFEYSAMIGEIA